MPIVNDIPPVAHHAYVDRDRRETNVAILSPECQFKREQAAIIEELRKRYGSSIDYDKIVFEKDFETNMIIVKFEDGSMLNVQVSYLPPLNPEIIGTPQRFELIFIDPQWN